MGLIEPNEKGAELVLQQCSSKD